jgi:hypothetical protein
MTLLAASKDSRFDVVIEPAFSLVPIDYSRNRCVASAREKQAEWLLMIDNDQTLSPNMLDVLAEAGPKQHVVGWYAGTSSTSINGQSFSLNCDFIPGVCEDRDFLPVTRIGAGVMALHNSVWQKLPKGPWFKLLQEDDELRTPKLGEDFFFCNLARAAGLQIWAYRMGAGHLKTCDNTVLALKQLSQVPRA